MSVMDSIVVLGKRKRNQISYAEPDVDYFEEEAEEVEHEEAALTDSDDATYGSNKVLRHSYVAFIPLGSSDLRRTAANGRGTRRRMPNSPPPNPRI